MVTTRPFAVNTGSTISGTTQYGNIAVGVESLNYGADIGGVKWYMGPDEDLGFVIGGPAGDKPQFWRTSTGRTDAEFLKKINQIVLREHQTPVSGLTEGLQWLSTNGYPTSYNHSVGISSFQTTVAPWQNYINSSVERVVDISDGQTTTAFAMKVTTLAEGSVPRCYLTPAVEGIKNNNTYKFNFKYFIPTGTTGGFNLSFGNLLQSIPGTYSTKGQWTSASITATLTTDINQYGQDFIEMTTCGTLNEFHYITDFEVLKVSPATYCESFGPNQLLNTGLDTDFIDSNDDGVADLWGSTYSNGIMSIVTGNGFTNRAQRFEINNEFYNGVYQFFWHIYTGKDYLRFNLGCIYRLEFDARSTIAFAAYASASENLVWFASTGGVVKHFVIQCPITYVDANYFMFYMGYSGPSDIGKYLEFSNISIKRVY